MWRSRLFIASNLILVFACEATGTSGAPDALSLSTASGSDGQLSGSASAASAPSVSALTSIASAVGSVAASHSGNPALSDTSGALTAASSIGSSAPTDGIPSVTSVNLEDGGSAPISSNPLDSGSGGTGDSARVTEVCRRWTADRMDMSEGTWSGNVDTCDKGDISAPARENALRLINLYRFLTGMPEVVMDEARNAAAQQCALLQSANDLSHTPPTTAICYTEEGASVAGKSSISSGKLVRSIDGYMTDGKYGDPENLGHRRWLLANSLGPIGLGSAIASCFYQVDGTGKANKAFVAWPPEGPVPLAALTTTQADSAGWSIQSDSIDLNAATVTVSDGGEDRPIEQYSLGPYYGSRYAVRLVPKDWESQAGHSYTVSVSGTDLTYTVDVVSCAGS